MARSISKVAVCGGSCSEYLEEAINSGADAFVTADVKYHAFQEAEDRILFIDAGHYETEIPSLNEVQKRLKNFLKNESKIKVFKYSGSTNPVIFYNN
ncbi:MAG: Nif3-like dinuclear metal center hexameric protein [Ignavibacteriaceae bacterium]